MALQYIITQSKNQQVKTENIIKRRYIYINMFSVCLSVCDERIIYHDYRHMKERPETILKDEITPGEQGSAREREDERKKWSSIFIESIKLNHHHHHYQHHPDCIRMYMHMRTFFSGLGCTIHRYNCETISIFALSFSNYLCPPCS